MSEKIYTISEAATLLDYEPHVLRFYESEFNIDVPRDKNNRRQYTVKEIETFQYIKELKGKGFNNSQIKEILKSPIIEDESSDETMPSVYGESGQTHEIAIAEVAMHLESLSNTIFANFSQINEYLAKLTDSIEELKNNQSMEEKDVLISENAKLKMRLKEKTYELVDMREKYSKLEQKKFIFRRLFK